MTKLHKVGTAIIIQNTEGKILLQLRDHNFQIKYPNTWVLFGGGQENNEKPEDTIKREIMEELGLKLDDVELYKKFTYSDQDEEHLQYVFYICFNSFSSSSLGISLPCDGMNNLHCSCNNFFHDTSTSPG